MFRNKCVKRDSPKYMLYKDKNGIIKIKQIKE